MSNNRQQLLRYLMNVKFGGRPTKMAQHLNRSSAQIGNVLHGRSNIGDALARHIEATLDLPFGWMDGKYGENIPEVKESKHEECNADFDILNIEMTQGKFIDCLNELSSKKISMPVDIAIEIAKTNLENVKIIRVRSTSMSPTINPGDLLFVDTSIDSYVGVGIYLIEYNGILLVKRIQKTTTYKIISDNEKYEDEEAEEKDIKICGFVVSCIGPKLIQ